MCLSGLCVCVNRCYTCCRGLVVWYLCHMFPGCFLCELCVELQPLLYSMICIGDSCINHYTRCSMSLVTDPAAAPARVFQALPIVSVLFVIVCPVSSSCTLVCHCFDSSSVAPSFCSCFTPFCHPLCAFYVNTYRLMCSSPHCSVVIPVANVPFVRRLPLGHVVSVCVSHSVV